MLFLFPLSFSLGALSSERSVFFSHSTVIFLFMPSFGCRLVFPPSFDCYFSFHLMVVGDFNFHVNKSGDKQACKFLSLCQSFNLKQHVSVTAHRRRNTLDLVMTRSEDSLVSSVTACDHGFPDHFPVFTTLTLSKPSRPTKQVTFRKLKSVTTHALSEAIDRSAIPSSEIGTKSLDELCHLYNSEFQCILDTVAPQKSWNITICKEAEWYTDEIRQAKQMRRQAERVWRKTGLMIRRQIFMERKQTVNNLLWSFEVNHYKCLISEHKSDTKQLFRIASPREEKALTSTIRY